MFARGTKTWQTTPLPARALALELSMYHLGINIVHAASLEAAYRLGQADREIASFDQHTRETVVVDTNPLASAATMPPKPHISRTYG
jgi:hypothetical protein